MSRIPPRLIPFLIALTGACFYFPFLGCVHLFDWDEINFAESAREMLVTGNYTRVQINFSPFWEKPPLFFWLQVLAMKAFGVNEFAARLPNALVGIATLLVLYGIGKKLVDECFGLLWALVYLGSLTPHLYFKSGIIDPTFNLFIFLGVWFLYQAVGAYGTRKATRFGVASGFLIGLAVLTKGPVGVLLLGLTFVAYWVQQHFRPVLSFANSLLFLACACAVPSLWFGLELIKNGFQFFQEFIDYQIRLFSTPGAGHAQPFYYHFVVVLLGCFPMSLLALQGFRTQGGGPADFRQWMVILFWVVMILFSIVRTKIVHYSSMAWFPVSYLAVSILYGYLKGRLRWNRWLTAGIALIGGLLALLLMAIPLAGMNAAALIPHIRDRFTAANLMAPVEWGGWEWLVGLGYGIAIGGALRIRRKRPLWGAITLFMATPVLLWLLLPVIVPKIERYIQGSVIDFYEAKQGQDIYIEPIGYKSYAHLFYFQKPPPTNPKSYDENWLLNGPVDKPTFFVTRNINADSYRYNPRLELVGEENGFIFFRRKPTFN